jgi:hypothetical protein
MPDAIHGALDFAELDHLGLAPEAVLDFSVNGNPYGPSPRVHEALAQVPYDRYPDREALALRRVLSTHLDVTIDDILVGNGSTELIWLVALAFVRAGDTVLLVGPTFGEYTRAAVLMGARLCQYTARCAEGFGVVPEVEEHRIDPEPYDIGADAAARLDGALAAGRRIVAVGTTTTRALESVARRNDGRVCAGSGLADLFIYPGFRFRVVGALLTNFHLPQSSLLMLVCAFAGRDLVLEAYRRAVAERYRFYSYGDAMLLI